jgi:ankyrin repeat protein
MKSTLVLILMGLIPSAQQPDATERFYQAIRNDNLVTLRMLVKEFGTHSKDASGQSPLMIAAAFGSPEALQLLITSGADVKVVSGSGLTALHMAARDPKKVRLLLDHGADIDVKSRLGKTPLLVAASMNDNAETVRMLLDKGAAINLADNTGVTPLIAAASVDDASVVKLLLARGAAINANASIGQASTALMAAAYGGNLELVKLLLSRGAESDAISADSAGTVRNGPVQAGNLTALHSAVSSGNADVVRMLLDSGVKVDAPDVRGMTPLMFAVSTDRPSVPIVRLLLQKGADASLRSKIGESTLDWVRKFNNSAVLAEFKLQPASLAGPTQIAQRGRLRTSREAVELSIPALRSASANVKTDGGCVACHAQPVTAMAIDAAAARAWKVSRTLEESAEAMTGLAGNTQILLQGRESGGAPDSQLYITFMMAALKTQPSLATDAFVYFLAAKQRQGGNWRGQGATRAPIQDGDLTRTAMAIRALSVYGTPSHKIDLAQRIERAAAWLNRQTPFSTEERVMQILGLKWANADARTREMRTHELVSAQRSDGGWGQTPFLVSDAYATGQVLYTLHEIGVPASDPAFQRAIAFLLRTQNDDGTWYVKSRAMKIQPYFESGFPYGHDQWISQTATAWAVIGLSLTAPEESVARSAR